MPSQSPFDAASTPRFPIRFDRAYALLSTALGIAPSKSYVELEGSDVVARMAWAFRARFPRTAVESATLSSSRPFSRGVHGWFGRWLVNGSGEGLVEIHLQPPQRAYVLGVPVQLERLMVSAEDPRGLVAALATPEGLS